MLARVASASSPANSASSRRRRPPAPARRCWKPCWATASPRSRQSSSHAARSGRRWKNGCRSGAGMTSSVARSMPWSASQSRISAQRSNVAGSTSWIATAIRRSPWPWLMRRADPVAAPSRRPARGASPRRGARARPPRCGRAPRRGRRARAARASPASPPGRRPRPPAPRRAARRAGRCGRRRPARPGRPRPTATTGRPDACASSTTWPNVSVCEQNRNRSADAYVAASSSPSSQPRNVAARPSRARSRSSSGPPPASTRCSRGSRARAARNASASRSTPFSRVSRPA